MSPLGLLGFLMYKSHMVDLLRYFQRPLMKEHYSKIITLQGNRTK